MEYDRFLVISIGTGSAKRETNYTAKLASKWGMKGWLYYSGSTPLIDAFTQASADLVDLHNSVIFEALCRPENYLRIDVRLLQFHY